MTVSARSDRQYVPADAGGSRFVVVRIETPERPRTAQRAPVNLGFVLDRSGSMEGEKIRLARRAVDTAIRRLDDRDQCSVVVYDDRVDVVLDASPASAEARQLALGRLEAIDARGSTDLGAGWLRGCEQVASKMDDRATNRTLLLTDGLANRGITDRAALAAHAAELRRRGVTTSTFGVGSDFDEGLLHAMADAGGGHFYFIAQPADIVTAIGTELGETLDIVARDVQLEVVAPFGVRVEPIGVSGWSGLDGTGRLLVGDLVSGQVMEFVFRFDLPAGALGSRMVARFRLHDRDGQLGRQTVEVAWSYVTPDVDLAQPRDRDVDHVVAPAVASVAAQQAVALNRSGQFAAAAAAVRTAAAGVAAFAPGDPQLQELVSTMEREADEYGHGMDELTRKTRYAAAYNVQRSREPGGGARRR